MEDTTLFTERFELESLSPNKIHWLFNTKSDLEICAYLGIDEAGIERYRTMHTGGMETYRYSHYYFVIRNKESRAAMGEIGFHTWDNKHYRAELFYLLRSDEHKNKGFMSEILPFVISFGFSEMKLNRIQALVASWNEPSVKLLNKFGFTFEGTCRGDYLVDGKFEDSDCYSLLAKEMK